VSLHRVVQALAFERPYGELRIRGYLIPELVVSVGTIELSRLWLAGHGILRRQCLGNWIKPRRGPLPAYSRRFGSPHLLIQPEHGGISGILSGAWPTLPSTFPRPSACATLRTGVPGEDGSGADSRPSGADVDGDRTGACRFTTPSRPGSSLARLGCK
jgi:hypothetical protein